MIHFDGVSSCGGTYKSLLFALCAEKGKRKRKRKVKVGRHDTGNFGTVSTRVSERSFDKNLD